MSKTVSTLPKNQTSLSKIDENPRITEVTIQKMKQEQSNMSLKGKLFQLDWVINHIYKDIDQIKLNIDIINQETEKSKEGLNRKFNKIDQILKDKEDALMVNAEDKFSKQRTINMDFIKNIRILKDDHIKLDKKLSNLQKKLSIMADHVGIDLKK